MTGISSSIFCRSISSSTAKPSIPSMWMSSSTMEIPSLFSSSRCRHSSPLVASAVSKRPPSISVSILRFMAESSTINTLCRHSCQSSVFNCSSILLRSSAIFLPPAGILLLQSSCFSLIIPRPFRSRQRKQSNAALCCLFKILRISVVLSQFLQSLFFSRAQNDT